MRALKITLRCLSPITLDLSYGYCVYSLISQSWRKSFPELHNRGLGPHGKKPFTFGWLQGSPKGVIDSEAHTIRFDRLVSFEVRSAQEPLLDELAGWLLQRRIAELDHNVLEVASLEPRDRLVFPGAARIRTQSPIVAKVNIDSNHTKPVPPTEATEWQASLQGSARVTAGLYGVKGVTSLRVLPMGRSVRKIVTTFKSTRMTGWSGDFYMSCDPPLFELLWCCGLGSDNSNGFGLFDILD